MRALASTVSDIRSSMRRLAVLALLAPLAACGDYSWSEIQSGCPDLMQSVITEQVGVPDSFEERRGHGRG